MKKLILILIIAIFSLSPMIVSANFQLAGRILLQVEANGEAWYVNPSTKQRHFLGRPDDAFNLMRSLGLGISEKDFQSFNNTAPARLAGNILLRVEANGEAYYVNPLDLKMHYLGRPLDAFNVMRNLGLGISNNDLSKIVLAGDLLEYRDDELGFSFMYPANWFIREEITENNNRIYIENQEYRNYNISNYPEDFLGMWIEYRKPTTETLSYEDQIQELDNTSAKKERVNESLEIHMYEFGYDPNSERSGVGPYLEAVWHNNSLIYNAITMDSDNRIINEENVNMLKRILLTLEFEK